ncbi:MAG: 30S ribosomal protein S3ae [Candidatus Diapherotrites archaeon]|uniref:Small ribosomal subunit protein eS1 n=1 Tax=Candidatus Iainarchaeum sp. TaxID=3101447 RepID=A0A2D6M0M6_9ARCH|nr:30S ribosomal protein S3ae [Candidatus Diapherotrites archaeon]|tara:strand:+ start:754 stop:1356 length:603 start_codon:yes stop_codon:yes gene_type:complete
MVEQNIKKKKSSGKRTVDKWKRKKWFKIFAPNEFDRKEVGETPATKDKNVMGRTIKINLGDLTGERQKRHINLTFKVYKIEGQQAFTTIVKQEINPIYINRMVRRRMSKIEAVQVVNTADNKKIKVKTIALSQKKLDRKQETMIRKHITENIENSAQKKEFSSLIQLIVFGVLASKLFKDLRKVAPLRRVEIVKTVLVEG